MGSMTRAMQRQRQREQERQQKRERAVQQKVNQVGDLGTYIEGYRSGYVDAYFQALADLKAKNVVDVVASQMIAVHHDPHEQAKYVLDKFQRAMTPKDVEAMKNGLDRAVTVHLQKLGVLPDLDGAAPTPEQPAEADEKGAPKESKVVLPDGA